MDWHSPSRSDTCDAHIFSARSQEGKKTWSVDRVWYSRVSVEGRTKEGGRDAEIAGPDDVASKRNGSDKYCSEDVGPKLFDRLSRIVSNWASSRCAHCACDGENWSKGAEYFASTSNESRSQPLTYS